MGQLNMDLLADLMAVGGVGFAAGVVMPLACRMVGWVVDLVKRVLL